MPEQHQNEQVGGQIVGGLSRRVGKATGGGLNRRHQHDGRRTMTIVTFRQKTGQPRPIQPFLFVMHPAVYGMHGASFNYAASFGAALLL